MGFKEDAVGGFSHLRLPKGRLDPQPAFLGFLGLPSAMPRTFRRPFPAAARIKPGRLNS